jgi:Na+:H+ antiporter, NhaA family
MPTDTSRDSKYRPSVPAEPIDRIVEPIVRFLHVEAASGIVLLLFTVAALALANSPWSKAFLELWKTPVGLSIGSFEFRHSVKHLINDGLMTIFFFVVGLEVKREIVLGELSDLRRAVLPLAAALGGAVVPAAIYLGLQHGQPAQDGWGIPMATDIAFVVGCVALLGSGVPHGLRVMLLSLAIADDIMAILVIAIGYSDKLDMLWLGIGVAGFVVIYACGRLGVRSFGVFTFLGTAVWFAFHESGVHATVAGVIIGLLTPARSYVSETLYKDVVDRARQQLHNGLQPTADFPDMVRRMQWATREVISPLEYLLNAVHPWVAFVIMPLFAFANAGVPVALSDVNSPIAIAVIAGLTVGKPLGIVVVSWVSVSLRIASLPTGVGWGAIFGGGCLAGIGFTMALFIAGLALRDPLLDMAKIGVLVGSFTSAVAGMVLLRLTLPAAAKIA